MATEAPENRSLDITEVFRDISSSIVQHNYRPRPEDQAAIRDCCLEWVKRPMAELTVGAIGGGIVSRLLVGPRLPAVCLGMMLCYNVADRQPAAEYCLRQFINLPTPLGTEAIEVVRAKDQNSIFLRDAKELAERPARIDTSAAAASVTQIPDEVQPQELQKTSDIASPSGQQDEPLWSTADPFDLFTDVSTSQQPAQPTLSPGQQLEEKRRKRQEAYRLRREQRRLQQQGVLLDGASHDDIFREAPR